MYEARYFADSDFLSSSLGHNPSFIWRSIFEAKGIVAAGVRWRIGPGTRIQISGQPWLADGDDPFVVTISPVFENQYVASLLCVDRRVWDEKVVRDVFNVKDQLCIFNTPVEDNLVDDVMYWNMEQSGIYSVKSAYKYLQVQKGNWRVGDNACIWRRLWKIKAPSKTLNLVWRALSNCLPTLTRLHHKHVAVHVVCPICKNGEETIFHALVACPFSTQCWQILDSSIITSGVWEFTDWLEYMLDNIDKTQEASVITLCWALWRARNDLVWNQKYPKVYKVVAAAKQYLAQWNAAQGRSISDLLTLTFEGDGAQTWVKPQPNKVKVTVDVAIFTDRKEFGFGLVARNSEGTLIQGKSRINHGDISPELAEAMAIKEALNWIDRMDWPEVIVESNCLVVIQAIRSKVKMRSRLGVVIEDCRCYLQKSNKISLYFIKRSANMVAHTLARASYNYPDRSFDRWFVPIEVRDCIVADLVI